MASIPEKSPLGQQAQIKPLSKVPAIGIVGPKIVNDGVMNNFIFCELVKIILQN